jgi:pyridoxamine 5'-phosphate oxidase
MPTVDFHRDYGVGSLREQDCHPDPIVQFGVWFEQVVKAGLAEPNAMTLATASAEGKPSARVLLLRGFDARGFVFFTNYESRKGLELGANPKAAMVFFWPEPERQVRIEGSVEQIAKAESDQYHRTRPRGSQMGAWCSFQSEVVAGREVLEARLRDLEEKFRDQDVPRPPHWGGYRLKPDVIEFWQGRPNRLHDRIRYRLVDGNWIMERLSP